MLLEPKGQMDDEREVDLNKKLKIMKFRTKIQGVTEAGAEVRDKMS